MSELQKKLQSEVEKYQKAQQECQKIIKVRQQLEAQLHENNIVKEELDQLDSGATVYKLIGPVLVKQDMPDAKQNVAKRIDYINGEIKRHEDTLKEIAGRQDGYKSAINRLQQEFQKARVQAAMKA